MNPARSDQYSTSVRQQNSGCRKSKGQVFAPVSVCQQAGEILMLNLFNLKLKKILTQFTCDWEEATIVEKLFLRTCIIIARPLVLHCDAGVNICEWARHQPMFLDTHQGDKKWIRKPISNNIYGYFCKSGHQTNNQKIFIDIFVAKIRHQPMFLGPLPVKLIQEEIFKSSCWYLQENCIQICLRLKIHIF